MSKKRQEIQLQQDIETQEEWEEMMAKEGLWVVDIYQEWCGPCAAMVSFFRRLKNELGDDLLHFATAKVDTIDALDKYKGKCEPTFLYFACGVLVAVVHGSQSPLVMRTVTEQLTQEHKVIDGNAQRVEIKDPRIQQTDDQREELDESESESEDNIYQYLGEHVNFGESLEFAKNQSEMGYTVAIIKPDAVRSGKVDEVLEQMKEKGIDIVAEEERQLTEEEAREFYSHLKDEDYFEELVQFMSSGPSHVLVLTKGAETDGSVLKEWRDMIGPTSVEEAKEQAPDSLRAKYGSGKYMNALHGSSSPETAAREMAFFFPKLAVSKKSKKGVERTLALIRPDAFRTNRDEILEKIRESGFKVALQKQMTLTKEQAAEFYKEHEGQPYFDDLVTRMSSGPLLALGLAREDAVQGWRQMLGPKEVDKAKEEEPESLRAKFAVDDVEINQLHGSDSPETAKKELEYFFPMQQTVACIKPDSIGTKDAIIDNIHDAGFRIAAQKETVITRDIAEEFYSEHKDKEYFNDLVNYMCSGPTMFMVLSKEDAVEGWRQTIGPTDPEKAKAELPESLRAIYGKDVLQNAVHGSSNEEHAKKAIEQVFGSLQFNSDGTVKELKPVEEQEQQAERKSPVQQVQETAPELKPETQELKPNETSTEQKATEDETQKTEQDTSKEDKTEEIDGKNDKTETPETNAQSQEQGDKPSTPVQEQTDIKTLEQTDSKTLEQTDDSETQLVEHADTKAPTPEQADTKSPDTEANQSQNTPEAQTTTDTKTDQSEQPKADESKPMDSESPTNEPGETKPEQTETKEEDTSETKEDTSEKKEDTAEKKEDETEKPKTPEGTKEEGAIEVKPQVDEEKKDTTKNESQA